MAGGALFEPEAQPLAQPEQLGLEPDESVFEVPRP